MSLEIQTDHAYAKPDLYINGTLTAYPDDREIPFKAASLLISLTGRSQSRVQGPDGIIHKQCVTFFEMSREVYPGLAELGWSQQTTYSLHLPNDPAAPRPSEGDMVWTWNRDKPPPQVLPPSGEFGTGNIITYELQAHMLDQSRLIREIKSNCLPVDFTQTRVDENVNHAITKLVQSQPIKTAGNAEGSLAFDAALEIPQVVVQGGAFPLWLYISSHSSNIRCSMESCCLNLIQNTIVTCGDKNKQTTDIFPLGSWSANSTANAASPVLKMSVDNLNLSKILDLPRIPASCAPSFSSGNIRRSYAFDVNIELLCENQTYGLIFNLDSLVVQAAETVDQAKAQQREEISVLNDNGWD